MRPRDFWRLHPDEFWWLFEAKQPVKNYAGLTETEATELYELNYGEDGLPAAS